MRRLGRSMHDDRRSCALDGSGANSNFLLLLWWSRDAKSPSIGPSDKNKAIYFCFDSPICTRARNTIVAPAQREDAALKSDWTADELILHWTLQPDERPLLGNKTGATRLGFALLLKFFLQGVVSPNPGFCTTLAVSMS